MTVAATTPIEVPPDKRRWRRRRRRYRLNYGCLAAVVFIAGCYIAAIAVVLWLL